MVTRYNRANLLCMYNVQHPRAGPLVCVHGKPDIGSHQVALIRWRSL